MAASTFGLARLLFVRSDWMRAAIRPHLRAAIGATFCQAGLFR
jgi:hypothetical protein